MIDHTPLKSEKQYESETGEKALYRKNGADYHTLRYVKWIQAREDVLEAEVDMHINNALEQGGIITDLIAERDKMREALERAGRLIEARHAGDRFDATINCIGGIVEEALAVT